ncbi:copper resistance protein CopC [Nocardia cyriacigeorgica]|uniref:Copper resistance protein CopC n=1 Tax=Nocardia cyriacigeorgica TaxID=135487 RepID=A0A5R8PC44_9NOCA|nr:copper resistance CopC family protein [Nocardia cyriacigeorgica]TLG08826.1 copper resistance protein CopC [Nocardia cyriacigeorgica]
MKRPIFLIALMAMLTLASGVASAHSSLVSSSPNAGESLPKAPDQVELVFNQAISPSFPTVAITAQSGERFDDGTATVEGEFVRTRVDRQVPAGTYTVGYRVVSADGHPITGSYEFTVTGTPGTSAEATTAAPTPAAAQPSEPETAGGPPPGAIIGLVAFAVAAVGGLGWVLVRSRRKA